MVALTVRQRFWQRVCIGADDECWNWMGSLLDHGHGQFSANGKRFYAHRYAMSLYTNVPEDKLVCHKCDNASCVNPNHLYVGTRSDNAQDMIKANTLFHPDNSGENSGMAKLTDEDVREVRSSSLSCRKTAALKGVSRSTVSLVRRGERWRHVA